MRNLVHIIVLSANSIIGFAQIEWAPPDAHWTYYHSNLGGNTLIEFHVTKDTIIDNNTCQVLGQLNQEKVITCHENGLVQLYRFGHFDTLYNFNAAVGDSWIIYDDEDPMYQTVWIKTTVVEKGTYQIGMDTLAMYIAEIEEHSLIDDDFEDHPELYTHLDTIVEKIGSITAFILPWDRYHSDLDGHSGGPLRCYADRDIAYNRNKNIACDSIINSHLIFSSKSILGMTEFSKWIYNYHNGWVNLGYHALTYGNDTIIGDRVANTLRRTQVYKNHNGASQSIDTIERSPLILFGSTDLVELLINNEFDTLYDFGGGIGDSWTNTILNLENIGIDITVKHTIVDTGRIELGHEAVTYDYFTVRYDYLNFNGEYVEDYQIDTIVRHIGNISRYILPWHSPPGVADFADGGPFRCYSDFDEIVYQKNSSEACDFIVSNHDLTLSNQILIYPNPTNKNLLVDVIDLLNEPIYYSIYSIDGRQHVNNVLLKEDKVSTEMLETGLYILQLQTSKDVFAIKKFYKN